MYSGTTTHYNLPQYSANDVPSILGDLNGAYEDIDAAIYDVASVAATADSKSTTAQTDAATALAGVSGAQADATQALADAAAAQADATQALSDASSASTAAQAAATAANTALSTAQSASNTAASAASDASDALAAVSQASSDASTALSTANSANTTAGNALTTAQAAQTSATSASTAAQSAQTTATSAQTTANTANGKADTNATAISGLDTRVTALEQGGSGSGTVTTITDFTGLNYSNWFSSISAKVVGNNLIIIGTVISGGVTTAPRILFTNSGSTAEARVNNWLTANGITKKVVNTGAQAYGATNHLIGGYRAGNSSSYEPVGLLDSTQKALVFGQGNQGSDVNVIANINLY